MTTDAHQKGRPSRLGAMASWGVSVLLLACAASTQRLHSELEADLPPKLRSDYVAFTQNCAKCHGLERALNSHVTDVHHWDLYVAKMMRTPGSGISANEAPQILRFLYWHTERKAQRDDRADERVLPELTEEQAMIPAGQTKGAEGEKPTGPVTKPTEDVSSNPYSEETTQGEVAP